jgi:hypothetical protein
MTNHIPDTHDNISDQSHSRYTWQHQWPITFQIHMTTSMTNHIPDTHDNISDQSHSRYTWQHQWPITFQIHMTTSMTNHTPDGQHKWTIKIQIEGTTPQTNQIYNTNDNPDWLTNNWMLFNIFRVLWSTTYLSWLPWAVAEIMKSAAQNY